MDSSVLSHGIQLAVAPVFMLTAVSGLLGVLAQRLARIIDRARQLEEKVADGRMPDMEQAHVEFRLLRRRGRIVNLSIGLLTLCGIMVGSTVVALFISEISDLRSSHVVPGFFLTGLSCFLAAMICFLWEILLATESLRFGKAPRVPRQDPP